MFGRKEADTFFIMTKIIQRALERAADRIDVIIAEEVKRLLSAPYSGPMSTDDRPCRPKTGRHKDFRRKQSHFPTGKEEDGRLDQGC